MHRWNMFVKASAAITTAVLFGGCASLGTYNPATQRNELIFISTPEEVMMGQDLHQRLAQEFKILEGAPDTQRLREIGRRVAAVSDRQDYAYQFFLIENEDLNAFTTPGGRIYMHSGLMNALSSDSQIAFVLAHEIGHCAARHTVKKYQAALGYNLIGEAVFSRMGAGYARQIASMSSNMIMNLVFSAYSRKDEYESDRLGVKYVRLAGFDPRAGVDVLNVLEKESEDSQGFAVLRSHPYLKDRIIRVEEEIRNQREAPAQRQEPTSAPRQPRWKG